VPYLFDFMTFPLAERPLASADHPFVWLGGTLHEAGGRWFLAHDPTPARVMWQQGARICHAAKSHDAGIYVVPTPAETPPVVLEAQGAGRFVPRGAAVSPLAIAGLRVCAAAAFERGDVEWLAPDGTRLGAVELGAGTAADSGWSAQVDLRHDFGFFRDGLQNGGLSTFVVRLTGGGGPVAVLALEVLSPAPGAPLDRTLRGARVSWAGLAARLPWTSLPADAEPGSESVVLLNGWRPLRFDRVQGELTSPVPMWLFLDALRRFVHVDRFYYYLECRRPSGVWRSVVDWFVLDTEAP
ncbi:MAG TPA: hypothetical protein VFT55_16910, partial [Planctomycetota bacterium]|nr:hypothetical protein [Planctomycetota bacterium]